MDKTVFRNVLKEIETTVEGQVTVIGEVSIVPQNGDAIIRYFYKEDLKAHYTMGSRHIELP